MSVEIDRDKVFFSCLVCSYIFEEDPERMPIRCPQCGSEDTERI